MKLFLEGKKYLLMRSLIMKASLKTLVRLAQFHMSCNITDNAMPFLLVFGLVIIVQSTSPCFKALVKKQPLSVDPRKAILVVNGEKKFSSKYRRELLDSRRESANSRQPNYMRKYSLQLFKECADIRRRSARPLRLLSFPGRRISGWHRLHLCLNVCFQI